MSRRTERNKIPILAKILIGAYLLIILFYNIGPSIILPTQTNKGIVGASVIFLFTKYLFVVMLNHRLMTDDYIKIKSKFLLGLVYIGVFFIIDLIVSAITTTLQAHIIYFILGVLIAIGLYTNKKNSASNNKRREEGKK